VDFFVQGIQALLNHCHMKVLRLLFLFVIIVLAASWFTETKAWKKANASTTGKLAITYPVKRSIEEKIQQKAVAAKKFVTKKGFNDKTCFLLDMSLPSGQKRFFIYNMRADTVQASALVAHGNCFEYWLEGRRYSNVVGSGCTSLGKYKIGSSYTGKFGYSYKLHGLDSSNNNAFVRTVVLHAHSCIPDSEVADDICQSNGCPTVSPDFLQQLKTIINTSSKPVLLWIYE
jgi:hypothetical protein